MKRKSDPRHKARVKAFRQLFEKSFRNEVKLGKATQAFQISQKRAKIDKLIAKNAPAWPIAQIAPVDLAILRLAIWELMYKKEKIPLGPQSRVLSKSLDRGTRTARKLTEEKTPLGPQSRALSLSKGRGTRTARRLTEGKTPYKVVIDEAVEIAKEYGSDSSASFVNGVLGAVVKNLKFKI